MELPSKSLTHAPSRTDQTSATNSISGNRAGVGLRGNRPGLRFPPLSDGHARHLAFLPPAAQSCELQKQTSFAWSVPVSPEVQERAPNAGGPGAVRRRARVSPASRLGV